MKPETYLASVSDKWGPHPALILESALKDLKKCFKDPKYIVDMSEWHTPIDEKCYVCLAGSVMAQTLGANPEESKLPSTLGFADMGGPDVANIMFTLNFLREGEIHRAYNKLKRRIPADMPDEVHINVPLRRYDHDLFLTAIKDLIKLIKQHDPITN